MAERSHLIGVHSLSIDPQNVHVDDWPCDNPADRAELNTAFARLDSLRSKSCRVCGSTENIKRGLCDDHEILSRAEPSQ